MLSKIVLAASAALVPLACASTVSHDFVLTRQNEEIHAVANDDMILEAFIEANHPATSENRSIELYGGDLSMYEFDEDEWQAMRTSLLQAAGIEEADVSTRDLAIRAPAPDDPPPFFCTNINTHPIAYTFSLSIAASGVCQGFVSGGAAIRRRQVARRNVENANRPGEGGGGFLRATITYTAKTAKWAVASGCGAAMAIGVQQTCNAVEEDTTHGEDSVSAGFTASDDEVAASITLTRG